MYFIMTALAAIVTTLLRKRLPQKNYNLTPLCLLYWGATLMWFIDHVIAFFLEGGPFLELSLDATMLGVAVVLCGFFLWVAPTLIKNLS